MTTQTLDHAGIAARVPHSGSMCLLDRLRSWSSGHIECSAVNHREVANPLRTPEGLLSVNGIEYAAQAMALHASLNASMSASMSASLSASLSAPAAAPAGGASAPVPGFLASVRAVRLLVPRLDEVAGELQVLATRLAGDARQALYSFALHDDQGRLLMDGRATVILNALP